MTRFVEMFPPQTAAIMVMRGSRYRLVDSFTCDWELDFTGWVGRMEIRDHRSEDAQLLADLTPYVHVVPSGTSAVVTVDIDADASELSDVDWSGGVYDIQITPTPTDESRTLRVLQGAFHIDPGVTT